MMAWQPHGPRRADPARQIARALAARFAGSVVATSAQPWASATFTGARHTVSLQIEAEARGLLAAQIAALAEAEFELRDHLVADCAVTSVVDHGSHLVVTVEALVVEAE